MAKGISIIKSIREPLDSAESFIKTLNNERIECNLCYVEELIFSNFSYIGKDLKQVIYLFSNEKSVGLLAALLQYSHKKIINFEYFLKSFSKESIQFLLFRNGFQVPQNYFTPEISQLSKIKRDLDFPLLLKSWRHGEERYILNSYPEYMEFVSRTKTENDVYVEKYLNPDNYKIFKAYGIGKVIHFNLFGNQIKTPQLIKNLRNIGAIFSLEVYSVDCIFNMEDGKVFFVDVNPSPAFGQSEEAYNCFIKYLKIQNL